MGLFLSSIKDERFPEGSEDKWCQPLSKVRDYHGLFKSLCDSFEILASQFEEIFSSRDKLEIWDREHTSKVDALQLFTGLIVFSKDSTFKERLKMLFTLFDFNEVKSLSSCDLSYLMLCVCNSTYKILGKNAKAEQLEISDWLKRALPTLTRERISITTLYRFCMTTEEVKQFLSIINFGRKLDTKNTQLMPKQNVSVNRHFLLDETDSIKIESESQINEKINWYEEVAKKTIDPKHLGKGKNHRLGLNWVYGFKCEGMGNPITHLGNSLIVYCCSSFVILYELDLHQQRHYTGHSHEVKCYTVGTHSKMIASVQDVLCPDVHIWSYQTVKLINFIPTVHKSGITHLRFTAGDTVLATVGARSNSPLIFYEVSTGTTIVSFVLEHRITRLLPLEVYVALAEEDHSSALKGTLIGLYETGFYHLQLKGRQCVRSCYEMSLPSKILCGLAMFANVDNSPYLRHFHASDSLGTFILTGHQDGSLVKTFAACNFNPTEQQIWKLKDPISCIKVCKSSLVVGSGKLVTIFDLSLIATANASSKTINLQSISNLRLMDYTVDFIELLEERILVITKMGEILQISPEQIMFSEHHSMSQEKVRLVNSIVRFDGQLQAMCLLQVPDSTIILAISHEKKVFAINDSTHLIDNIWEIAADDTITTIDAMCTEENTIYVACGCRSGRIFIRVDWQEDPKPFECPGEVIELKLSRDCLYLLAAVSDRSLMFFNQSNKQFSSPRRLAMNHEIPVSINFLDNFKYFAVSTSAKNVYLVEIPQLKMRNLLKETDKVNISQAIMKYPNNTEIRRDKIAYTVGCVGSSMQFYLVALCSGEMLFFEKRDELYSHSYTRMSMHQGPIAALAIPAVQNRLYTMGMTDKTVIEWRVHPEDPVNTTNCQLFASASSIQADQRRFSQDCNILCTRSSFQSQPQDMFFFKGTKVEKLNQALRQCFSLGTPQKVLTVNEERLSFRHPPKSLYMRAVYGINCSQNGGMLYLDQQGQYTLHKASRFLIKTEVKTGKQTIFEPISNKISCFLVTKSGLIIYSEAAERPKIYVYLRARLETTFSKAILQLACSGHFVLSYGFFSEGYGLNLHNYQTGKLMCSCTTRAQITRLLMLSERRFLSLKEIRVWQNMFSSSPLGFASAGAILPNQRDVCLGTTQGSIEILTAKGISTVALNAHESEISDICIRSFDDQFEVVTVGLDEKVKIWDSFFRCRHQIDLRENDKYVFLNDENRPRQQSKDIRVICLDTRLSKILMTFASGQAFQLTVYEIGHQASAKSQNIDMMLSSVNPHSKKDLAENKSNSSIESESQSFTMEWRKIAEGHSNELPEYTDRPIVFTLHSSLPILASVGGDSSLILRNYETNKVLAIYCFEGQRVNCIQFGRKANVFVVGLSEGELSIYRLATTFNAKGEISDTKLQFSQRFLPQRPGELVEPIIIQFSPDSLFFGVSYLSRSKGGSSEGYTKGGYSCFVQIYKAKDSLSEQPDQVFYNLEDTVSIPRDDKLTSASMKCVYFMSFVEIDADNFVVFYDQHVNDKGCRVLHPQANPSYQVYSIEEKSYKKIDHQLDWLAVSFPTAVRILLKRQSCFDLKADVTVTVMCMHQDTIFYGGSDGKVFVVRLSSLDTSTSMKDLSEKSMCLGKAYPSHTSFITQLELSADGRFLFAGGASDQCVTKLEILNQEITSDLDYEAYNLEVNDLHEEVPSEQTFQNFISNIHPIRMQITDILQDVESDEDNTMSLEILKVFGRRAVDRRNNLYVDDDQVLFILGPNIVSQGLYAPFKQEVIAGDPDPHSHNPQISCFQFKRGVIILATEEQRARIFIWNVKSHNCLDKMVLNCSIPLNIKQMNDSQAAYYGINEQSELIVQLIDWRLKEVIGSANFLHSANWKIKDIAAMEDGQSFVTCGVQHVWVWRMRGSVLTYEPYGGIPYQTTFMVICPFKETLIAGCETGKVYFLANFSVLNVFQVHSAAIRTLLVTQTGIIITAGIESTVILSEKHSDELKPIVKKSLAGHFQQDTSTDSYLTDFDVQSLALVSDNDNCARMVVGTRSGDIYDLEISLTAQAVRLTQVLCAHDNDMVVSVSFVSEGDIEMMLTITASGTIQAWSLKTFQKIFRKEIGKKSKKIFYLNAYNILVCCENSIFLVRLEHDGDQVLFNILSDSRITFEGSQITECCLCRSYLSLALSLNETNEILIYSLNPLNFGEKLSIWHHIINLKYQIQYMDYSKDHTYLLFKDRFDEIGLIKLADKVRINTIFVEMNIEWESIGIRISPDCQDIYASYGSENRILVICRLAEGFVAVGDQMGTIRIFRFPCRKNKLGELHTKCYNSHMGGINNLILHSTPSRSLLASTSIYDRSLIIWQVYS